MQNKETCGSIVRISYDLSVMGILILCFDQATLTPFKPKLNPETVSTGSVLGCFWATAGSSSQPLPFVHQRASTGNLFISANFCSVFPLW